jgi:membrane-bound lytic murein transglycosylase A
MLAPRLALASVLALAVLSAGCVSEEPAPRDLGPKDFAAPLAPGEMALERVPDGAWPDLGVSLADREGLIGAIDQSLAYFAKPSSKAHYPYLEIDHDRVVGSLRAFRDLVSSGTEGPALAAALRARFDLYRSKGRARTGEVLFTSYCEPIYDASLTPTETFCWPLLRRPPELLSDAEGHPLGWRNPDGVRARSPLRSEIDAGMLRNRGLEFVWLRDPLEAYLIHVQGSARLRLPDGTLFPVGYAGKTEHPYRSLGKALIRDGKIREEDMSLAAIRAYFGAHPGEVMRYLAENPSYVFFTEAEGGPFGSLGARVTARATIATDKEVFPRGALAFVDARLGGARFRQFVLDQDTGGAIRSAGRCDIFAGTGPDAERTAGATMSVGRLYYLFLKATGTRS